MHQYYIDTSLNIIAAAAEDPNCGIFDSTDLLRVEGIYKSSLFENYKTEGPNFVEKRAWAF